MKRTSEVEYLPRPSIEANQDMAQNMVFDIETNLWVSWMYPIIQYLTDGNLPEDDSKAHRIKAQVSRYWLSPTKSSTKGCTYPLFSVRSPKKGKNHPVCWWAYIQKDAFAYTQKCDKYQKHSLIIH